MYFISIIIIICIIILLPLVLDYVSKKIYRERRIDSLIYDVRLLAKEKMKPIILFTDLNVGYIIDPRSKAPVSISENLFDTLDKLSDDECFILLVEVLEYVPPEMLKITVDKINRVSGGNFFMFNHSKGSLRMIWDYKVKNLFASQTYSPNDRIQWAHPSDLQTKITGAYKNIFRVIPYEPIKKLMITDIIKN